jgi:hypothetical protein
MKKIFLLSIYIVLILFINNKVYSAPLIIYDYISCNHESKEVCNKNGRGLEMYIMEFGGPKVLGEPEYDMLFQYRTTFAPNTDLTWDIKAKDNKKECSELKEIDRISCLILNVVKICEKNPKLDYCEFVMNNSDKKIDKNYWNNENLVFKVIYESSEDLSSDYKLYKYIVIQYSKNILLEFHLQKIADKYKISYITENESKYWIGYPKK